MRAVVFWSWAHFGGGAFFFLESLTCRRCLAARHFAIISLYNYVVLELCRDNTEASLED